MLHLRGQDLRDRRLRQLVRELRDGRDVRRRRDVLLERRLPEQDFTTFLNSLDDAGLQEFARDAMPAGALVEAGTSEGGSAYAVRELTTEDTPFARAAAARAGQPK